MVSCRKCGDQLQPGQSVKMICSCSAFLCQKCARNALLETPQGFQGSIQCPNCLGRNAAAPSSGNQEAVSDEEHLILIALECTGRKHSPSLPGRVDSHEKLQFCLNGLRRKLDSGAIEDTSPEPVSTNRKNNVALERKLNEMRREISVKVRQLAQRRDILETMKKELVELLEGIKDANDPLDRICFTVDPFVEAIIALENDPTAKPLPNCCFKCNKRHPVEGTVHLSCDCFVLLCRYCAISALAVQDGTYNAGVACPSCHVKTIPAVTNRAKLEHCEKALLESAKTFITKDLLPTGGRTEIADLLCLMRAVYGFTDGGEPIRAPHKGEHGDVLRIKVACLEEAHLRKAGLLNAAMIFLMGKG